MTFEYIKRLPWLIRGGTEAFGFEIECIDVVVELTGNLENGGCDEGGCCSIGIVAADVDDGKADFWISLDSLDGSSLTINPILAAGAKSSLSRLLLESFIGLSGSSLMDVSEGTELLMDIYG